MVGMYVPMSRETHLKRGFCCESGCLHCPWDFSNKGNPPISKEEIKKFNISHLLEKKNFECE
ncbi:MAG: hypothetical protein HQM13_05430 [SAR324 cluster bacterium]|nr:hypothetical protein [SAR324 cluster bacterium]